MTEKIIDLFCGVGGMSLGFEWAGFETVAAIDNWSDAIETFNRNRVGNIASRCSVSDFNEFELASLRKKNSIAGVIGGPPCQGFSTARLSDNGEGIDRLNGPRNNLYLEFVRTVSICRPKFFVLENVRGLTTMKGGAYAKDIVRRFGELGYSVTFQLLDAANYGVPQHRVRVFFVGFLDRQFQFPRPRLEQISAKDAIDDLPEAKDSPSQPYNRKAKNAFQELMRRGSSRVENHQVTRHAPATIDVVSRIPDGGSIKSLPAKFWEIRKFNKAFQRMSSRHPSLTIDTGHRNYFHYSENRVPTVRESARLQSFPDRFVFVGSKTSQYTQVGNAVPPILAQELALEIMKVIKK